MIEFRIRYARADTGLFSYYYIITGHSDEAVKEKERLVDAGFNVGPIEWNNPDHGWIPMLLLEEIGDENG